jgi:hypothetical protein
MISIHKYNYQTAFECILAEFGDVAMPSCSRNEIFDETEVGVYHCYARCVRRCFLCGDDPDTGKNFEHRREWIRLRLQRLATVFAIDVGAYCVLQNHFHVLLRNRPDIVETWSDEEVVRRWKRLSAKSLELAEVPADEEVQALLNQPQEVAELRRRLSHISWFMAMLDESVSRAANAEDGCSGHFWQERYKCQRLDCEAAILACAVYIDLNLIRAMIADTPETSMYTSVHDRIQDLAIEQRQASSSNSSESSRETDRRQSGWLAPVWLEGDGYAGAAAGRRASDKGLLPIPLEKYLELVDWSGRQLRCDKRGAIPDDLASILERLGISSDSWLDGIEHFGLRFGKVVGGAKQVLSHARRSGRRWNRGITACRATFGSE